MGTTSSFCFANHPKSATSIFQSERLEDNIAKNTTPFGKILRGDSPSTHVFLESANIVSFRDYRPRAPLHALVIPRYCIPTIHDIVLNGNNDEKEENLKLLYEMKEMAYDILRQEQPVAFHARDYILCFHLPPFHSVNHLHLHVLAPASKMPWCYSQVKYRTGTIWCADLNELLERLEKKCASSPTLF